MVVLAGCGGGGGGGAAAPAPAPVPGSPSGWVPGSFLPAESFAAQCVNPRTGTDPDTGLPYADIKGTTLTQNNWLRSWSNDLYLWYDEIVDRDPGLYDTPAYFGFLKTTATTAYNPSVDATPSAAAAPTERGARAPSPTRYVPIAPTGMATPSPAIAPEARPVATSVSTCGGCQRPAGRPSSLGRLD